MKQVALVELRTIGHRLREPRLNELIDKVIEDYHGVKDCLIDIEQATVNINDGERLRMVVREKAANAVKEHVLK